MVRNESYDAVLAAPGFRIGVRCSLEAITGIDFLPESQPLMEPDSALAKRCSTQIAAYLRDPACRFDLPLARAGTDFQRGVWREIEAIPCGETRTYGALARRLGSAARAVGQACGANPYPVVVPCHRVLAAGGLGGFAHQRGGMWLMIKRWLLEHERALG